MRALVPFPDHPYFLWQVLVHWTWMRKHEYRVRYLGYASAKGPPSKQLCAMIEAGVPITCWNDWRRGRLRRYGPGMKPGLVARWMEAHADEPFLVLDPDALPLPSFYANAPTPTATQWYGTDVDSYTGAAYLRSKGEDLWIALCNLATVNPADALGRAAVGAQLAGTGQPAAFWDDVHRLAVEAHRILDQHPSDVQVWCAEMYMTQLLMIREGIDPTPSDAMAMVWATGPVERWDDGTAGFFHDAGVPTPNGTDFCKIEHQVSPFGKPLHVAEESASARYVELIRETESMFPTLLA